MKKATFQKEEKSLGRKILSRILIYSMLAVVMFYGMAYWNALSYPPEPPMDNRTSAYTPKVGFALAWPYTYKYYLYKPNNYNPGKEYPLLVLLHGQSRHMYGGKYILDYSITNKYPALIVVPIAPAEMDWANPSESQGTMALPFILDAIKSVQSKYSVDPKRIYVSGYSLGGTGTFAAVEYYPDVFAAAMPLCGYWDPSRASSFPKNVPIWAIHGSQDGPEASRNMVNALKAAGKSAFYTEYPGVGHNVWDYVYKDPKVWDWLFAQGRK